MLESLLKRLSSPVLPEGRAGRDRRRKERHVVPHHFTIQETVAEGLRAGTDVVRPVPIPTAPARPTPSVPTPAPPQQSQPSEVQSASDDGRRTPRELIEQLTVSAKDLA